MNDDDLPGFRRTPYGYFRKDFVRPVPALADSRKTDTASNQATDRCAAGRLPSGDDGHCGEVLESDHNGLPGGLPANSSSGAHFPFGGDSAACVRISADRLPHGPGHAAKTNLKARWA